MTDKLAQQPNKWKHALCWGAGRPDEIRRTASQSTGHEVERGGGVHWGELVSEHCKIVFEPLQMDLLGGFLGPRMGTLNSPP